MTTSDFTFTCEITIFVVEFLDSFLQSTVSEVLNLKMKDDLVFNSEKSPCFDYRLITVTKQVL